MKINISLSSLILLLTLFSSSSHASSYFPVGNDTGEDESRIPCIGSSYFSVENDTREDKYKYYPKVVAHLFSGKINVENFRVRVTLEAARDVDWFNDNYDKINKIEVPNLKGGVSALKDISSKSMRTNKIAAYVTATFHIPGIEQTPTTFGAIEMELDNEEIIWHVKIKFKGIDSKGEPIVNFIINNGAIEYSPKKFIRYMDPFKFSQLASMERAQQERYTNFED